VNKTILIVDDSLTTRLMTRILITKSTSYQVVEAKNGTEALEVVTKQIPDLIVMDIIMPGMDGLEVCWRLRQDRKTKEIPIVLLTSERGEAAVQSGFANGCTAYLNKPVEERKLLDTLRTYLEN
jgi:CheY-like chemotaxis protein